MTDPTPEERATNLMVEYCIGHEDSWEDWTDNDGKMVFVNDHYFITREIRLAVLAERERCVAPVDQALKVLYSQKINEDSYRSAVSLLEAIAEAIRKDHPLGA